MTQNAHDNYILNCLTHIIRKTRTGKKELKEKREEVRRGKARKVRRKERNAVGKEG